MTKVIGDEAQLSKWLNAEATLLQPQPKGSITSGQYAKLRSRSHKWAREKLLALYRAGLAEREICNPDGTGRTFAYTLKK